MSSDAHIRACVLTATNAGPSFISYFALLLGQLVVSVDCCLWRDEDSKSKVKLRVAWDIEWLSDL